MGSFYATCSISRQTICDNQEMYMQFMLPNNYFKDISIGEYFLESFLNVVESEGLEKAMETWKESTSTWGKENELSPKGLIVSNDGAYRNWVPFGPAIRGKYDDYGNIAPGEDEDSQRRVKILEGLMGLPFKTIQDVAQDDRWFTLGLGKYQNEEDSNKNWRPEGIDKDMPEWQLILCKKLSLTYFHTAVYDEVSKFDFAPDEINGIMKSKYSIKWKNEYFEKLDKLPEAYEMILKNSGSIDFKIKYKLRDITSNIGIFRFLSRELSLIYIAALARENASLDWLKENLSLMYGLSGMNISLNQSEYGSQTNNFYGWKRINSAMSPKIDEYLKKYEDDEE
jgi:hypothetical protein